MISEEIRHLIETGSQIRKMWMDGVRLKRTLTEKDQLRPLARLSLSADLSPHVTLADRARFLKSYLTRYGSGVPDWKLLWQQIVTERESRFQDHIAG